MWAVNCEAFNALRRRASSLKKEILSTRVSSKSGCREKSRTRPIFDLFGDLPDGVGIWNFSTAQLKGLGAQFPRHFLWNQSDSWAVMSSFLKTQYRAVTGAGPRKEAAWRRRFTRDRYGLGKIMLFRNFFAFTFTFTSSGPRGAFAPKNLKSKF